MRKRFFGETALEFEDNFNRTATFAYNRSTEVADGNDWLAYSNQVNAGVGISSNVLALSFNADTNRYASYRRILEGYSSLSPVIHEFDYLTDNGDGQWFSVAIGSSIKINNSAINSFFDGIMFKYYPFASSIRICNAGGNKATGSLLLTPGSIYRIKIYCTPSFMGVKIWLKSGSEPSEYTIEYTGALVADGNYLSYSAANDSSNESSYNNIDNQKTIVIN